MIVTNNFNLPESIYKALSTDSYTKGDGDYSVTEILNPPQLVQLKRRYADKLTEDAMDRCWSLFGSAVHHILEKASPTGSLSEERLYVDILGRKLGGQVDCYHEGVIEDFKITSAFTLVYGSRINEWTEQLNSYAYIFRQNGYPVHKLQIVTILRDWNKNKALQDRQYPQTPIVVLPITLWSEQEQLEHLERQVSWQIYNEETPDEELDQCRPEDCWEQETKWAVMKEGRKSALRVFDDESDVFFYMQENDLLEEYKPNHTRPKEGYSVVKRPGRRTRCEDGYCPVRDWCFQYKEYKEAR